MPKRSSQVFSPDQYSLLDFGRGRKLERFGPFVLDRPSPAAETARPLRPELWRTSDARFESSGPLSGAAGAQRGEWIIKQSTSSLVDAWRICHDQVWFELKLTEFGHVGVFPEQAENWDWLDRQIRALRLREPDRPVKVLNLFAYTGGSTHAAAAAGAEVVHVDAASNTVAWARRNAHHSGLAGAPIRWISEDAPKFAARELKRGNRYDAVILDPPTYGHGPKGEVWRIERDLPPLLSRCAELTAERRAFVLLTTHSPGIGPAELQAYLADCVFGHCGAGATAADLYLKTSGGRRLHAGVVARWPDS